MARKLTRPRPARLPAVTTTPGVVSRVALNAMEDRLRRLYGQAGEIGATFTPHCTIVLDGGSLNDPGLNFFDGRSFCTTLNFTGAGALMAALKAVSGVVITSAVFSCSPTTEIWMYYGPSDVADPGGITLSGAWTELGERTGDRPPILAASGIAAVPLGIAFWIASVPAGATEALAQPVHLPPGSKLYFVSQTGAATYGRVNVQGYVQEGS